MKNIDRKLDLLINICNRNTFEIKELHGKLDQLLAGKPTNSRAANLHSRAPVTGDLWFHRVLAVERTFWRLVNCDWLKRQSTYNFPAYLLERLGSSPTQSVVVSVLLNQCAILKALRPVEGESGDTRTVAYEALKKSTLFITPAKHAFDTQSDTEVAMSPGAAEKFVRNKSRLPETWKGWTCNERGIAPDQPLEDREVYPIKDIAGVRDWGDVEAPKDSGEPLKPKDWIEDVERDDDTDEEEDAWEEGKEDLEPGDDVRDEQDEAENREQARRERLKPVDVDDVLNTPEPSPAKPAKPYKVYEKRVDPDGVPVIGGRRFLMGRKDEPEKDEPEAAVEKPVVQATDPLAGRPGLRPLNVVSRSTDGE